MTHKCINNIINLRLTNIYNLSNDYLFKQVFFNKRYLKELLFAFFNIKANNITYLNTELLKKNKLYKAGISDLLLNVDGKFIILEYQNINRFNFENRLLFYSSKLVANYGLKKKEDYKYLKKFKILAIVNYPYLNNDSLSTINLKHKNNIFTKNMEYKIANIKAISKDNKHIGYNLANMFTNNNLLDMEKYINKDIYKEIFEKIKYYNLDDKEWLKMDEIAKLLINEKENYSGAYDAGKIEGISKGISQGITRGTNQMVINMLDNELDIDLISRCAKMPEWKILEIKKEYTKNKVKS